MPGIQPDDDDDATVQFPVTFKSADLFAVTKTKLYSTFSISMKVYSAVRGLCHIQCYYASA